MAYAFLLQYFSLSPSQPYYFSFLYSTQSVSCTLPFRPFCPRTLPLSFPLSLSACFSCTLPSLCTLVFLCPLLAPISNISLALSSPPLVPSIPRSLLRTSTRSLSLYHALEHHHSPPELTSLLYYTVSFF
jgi:hypothetical protein